ncbi:MAG: ArnT family glycosyltransferase [Flavobacteriales bacterium]
MKTSPSGHKLYLALFGLCGLAYIAGLFFPIQGVDANQYFAMSQEMLKTGNYLEIYHRGYDYLDKPPLLFWITSLFFKVFGVGEWQYRLPSFLFTLLAVYSTYRLGKLLYNEHTGKLAALLLFSCQAFFLFNHDVRTDTILTGSIIFAVWQLISYLQNNSWKHLILGFVGVGLGMLAKGPMGIVLPAMALGTHVLIKGEWKQIFKWQWIVGLLITGAILSPMLWGIYHQFDLHPEKTVNGRTGVSGIYFFFWEQSFGRITGENVWKDDSTPFFFTHTYLWSYLPWSIAGIAALVYSIRTLLKKSLRQNREYYTLGGTLLPFLALSTSNFKLPHYIFIIYPLMSVLVADFLLRFKESKPLLMWGKLFFVLLIACVGSLLILILTLVFPSSSPALWALTLMTVVFPVLMLFTPTEWLTKLVSAAVCLFALTNLFLNIHFYPKLAPYDAGYSAGVIITTHGGTEIVHALYENSFAIEVSGRCGFKFHNDPDTLIEWAGRNTYVYTSQYGYEQIKEADIDVKEVHRLNHYVITLLKKEFLNVKTRPQTLDTMYLLKI